MPQITGPSRKKAQDADLQAPNLPKRTIMFETGAYISYNLSLSTDVGDS